MIKLKSLLEKRRFSSKNFVFLKLILSWNDMPAVFKYSGEHYYDDPSEFSPRYLPVLNSITLPTYEFAEI